MVNVLRQLGVSLDSIGIRDTARVHVLSTTTLHQSSTEGRSSELKDLLLADDNGVDSLESSMLEKDDDEFMYQENDDDEREEDEDDDSLVQTDASREDQDIDDDDVDMQPLFARASISPEWLQEATDQFFDHDIYPLGMLTEPDVEMIVSIHLSMHGHRSLGDST